MNYSLAGLNNGRLLPWVKPQATKQKTDQNRQILWRGWLTLRKRAQYFLQAAKEKDENPVFSPGVEGVRKGRRVSIYSNIEENYF